MNWFKTFSSTFTICVSDSALSDIIHSLGALLYSQAEIWVSIYGWQLRVELCRDRLNLCKAVIHSGPRKCNTPQFSIHWIAAPVDTAPPKNVQTWVLVFTRNGKRRTLRFLHSQNSIVPIALSYRLEALQNVPWRKNSPKNVPPPRL